MDVQTALASQKPKHKKVKPLPYFLLAPVVILLLVFTFYPFFRNIYLTFFVTNSLGEPGAYVGFRNYVRVFTDPSFAKIMKATFRFAILIGVGTLSLAMFFAYLCIQKTKGSIIYQTMFTLPMALASVPIGAIARYLFSKYGLINALSGLDIAWLSTKETAIYCVALVTVWSNVGTSFLFLLVGFRNVSEELVESSMIDGASKFQRFFKIYLPIASPQVFFVVFLNILNSFQAYAIIRVLVGSGPSQTTNVLIYALYTNALVNSRFETACVYSLILFALIFTVTRIQLLLEKKVVHYQ